MPRDDLDRRKLIEQAVTAPPLTSQADLPADSVTIEQSGKTALVTAVTGMAARIEIDRCRASCDGPRAPDRDRHRLHQSCGRGGQGDDLR